jgi:hypothetical protein
MNFPKYPDILNSSDWQKEKSIIAKVLPGKKTGIGEAMDLCRQRHTEVAHKFSMLTSATQDVPDEAKRDANSYMQALKYVVKAAEDAAAMWRSKLSPVPRSTRKHAEDVARVANEHWADVKKISGLR